MMKKVLAVAAVACVVCVAGTALAQQHGRGNQSQQMNHPRMMFEASRDFRPQNVSGDFHAPHKDFRPGQPGQPTRGEMRSPNQLGHEGMRCGFKGGHREHIFTPDMPKEIRAKAVELAKLRIDLEEAMTSRPLNKEKALEVHAKMQKVEQEIDAWRFAKKLEHIEAMQKQHELNRNVPPARPGMPAPEKPAPEAPAPAPEEAQ